MRGSSVGRVLQSQSDILRPGQLVNCLPDAIGWQQYGVCSAGQVIPLPEQAGIPSSAWAGVLGGTGLTAYFGLLRVGKVQVGDVVLVSSAAGAVGSVVCQLAKRVFGCRVVGIAGGLDKCEWLIKHLGVDVAVDYKSPDFAQQLKSAMKAHPANVVFDNVGGKVLDEMLKHLSKHARVVLCGSISGVANNPIANHMSLIVKSASMTGFILFDYESEYQFAYGELSKWILQGKLQLPGEDMVMGLDRAPSFAQALSWGEQGQLVGWLMSSPLPPLSQPTHSQPVRVLCWIPFRYQFKNKTGMDPLAMTSSQEQVDRILNTYAKLCDKFYFVTQFGNETSEYYTDAFLAHNYERKDNRDLWNQVSRGWLTVGQRHLEEFEWFIKLDSDSFLIPGNLRLALKQFDPNSLRYFGHTIFEQNRRLDDINAQFNVGAGYGISRGLLRKILPYIVRDGVANPSPVPEHKRCVDLVRWGEDVKFADCLRVVVPDLKPELMHDNHDRELFYPFEPSHHLLILRPGVMDWFWRGKDLNHTRWRFGSLTSRPVLFHHVKLSRGFYFLDYLFHRVAVDPIISNL
ncbi:hypothetical protein BASA81_008327 [Batrachochytrium salamandrivorans]|nr:hypothetical protein BASA81_008327 [Batrachochytrium salamandrivorans]